MKASSAIAPVVITVTRAQAKKKLTSRPVGASQKVIVAAGTRKRGRQLRVTERADQCEHGPKIDAPNIHSTEPVMPATREGMKDSTAYHDADDDHHRVEDG